MKEDRMSLLKYILVGAIGFGIGGVIWGFILFRSIPPTVYLPNLFSYTTGGIALGAVGGASLASLSMGVKKMLRFALFGAIGFFSGFIITAIISYPLFIFGSLFVHMFLLGPESYKWEFMFRLKPSLAVGEAVLCFVVAGAIGGFFYGLAEKKNLGSFALHGAIGFGVGSLIAPVFGNLVEMASNSLLAAYVTTFMIIGVILGAFLGRCVYLAEKQTIGQK